MIHHMPRTAAKNPGKEGQRAAAPTSKFPIDRIAWAAALEVLG